MSTDIAVRLPAETVALLDRAVATRKAPSRAALVAPLWNERPGPRRLRSGTMDHLADAGPSPDNHEDC